MASGPAGPPADGAGAGSPDPGGQGSLSGEVSIDIRLPADPGRLPLLRSVAGALAGAQDYDIDTIADLRMAVDELLATVIRRARPGAAVSCALLAASDGITVTASAPAGDPTPVDETSFGWMVLTTLADEVAASVTDTGSGPMVSVWLRVTPGRVSA
jgi:serine/threonine-protein kinase RsbW